MSDRDWKPLVTAGVRGRGVRWDWTVDMTQMYNTLSGPGGLCFTHYFHISYFVGSFSVEVFLWKLEMPLALYR